jgi:cobalt transporter subunit CbtB
MQNQTLTASVGSKTSAAKLLQLLGGSLLAIVILYGVGFAHIPVAHNAAHDVRHSQGFPCH